VCLFLLGVLLPACRKSRVDSARITCARNLAEIGKAMFIYTNDYDGEFPRAGGRNPVLSNRIQNWLADNRFIAYGTSPDGSGGFGSITASFYLLVKYAQLKPEFFICKGDIGATEFSLADDGHDYKELVDLWDFGLEPRRHCSYSYHMPYGPYALTTSSEPGMAVAADPSPWIIAPAADPKDITGFDPDGDREAVQIGNAIPHNEDGQNVLFVDIHVSFEKQSFCGVNDDNIYTYWDGPEIRRGAVPARDSQPADRLDSLLVNDFH
jgi:hypothetical protein